MSAFLASRPLVLGLFLAFAALVGGFVLRAPSEVPLAQRADFGVAVSEARTPAPDFALETIGGETFRLSEQRGRVVVLNFWATWCPPCRYEIPDFIAMQSAFGADDVVFVGVSLDEGGPAVVRSFADRMEINYPLVLDDGSVSAAYGPLTGLPMTFLIDRAGEVRSYAPGMVTRDMIEPEIAALVAER